jgi:thiazole synthase
MREDLLQIGPYSFRSRLILGTGKYPDYETMRKAIIASGAELVTVAIRRVNLDRRDPFFRYLDLEGVRILPNTAGATTAEEAIHIAHLAREALETELIKLEIIGDPRTLYPDPIATLKAAEVLVKEGFLVMPYTNDDPVIARKLVDAGCPVVMPLLAPIGSGLGIQNFYNLRILREEVQVPLIVDAGVGVPSHACRAMELGVDGVLMNTAVARAEDPVSMATAMKLAVQAGRLAYLAGPMKPQEIAEPSSPIVGIPSRKV